MFYATERVLKDEGLPKGGSIIRCHLNVINRACDIDLFARTTLFL